MNDLEMFISLTAGTQRRILRMARDVARATHNRIDYYSVVSAMTVTAYDRMRDAQRLADEKMQRQRDGWQHQRSN